MLNTLKKLSLSPLPGDLVVTMKEKKEKSSINISKIKDSHFQILKTNAQFSNILLMETGNHGKQKMFLLRKRI